MAATAVNEKVTLNFAWMGPNSRNGGSFQGGRDVLAVDLMFKNAKTAVSVRLQEGINPLKPQRYAFVCRKQSGAESYPDSLRVSIDQIHNLRVKAAFYEKGRSIGPRIMDSSGKITQEHTLLKSYNKVKLEIPEELEIGQTYCLIVTSVDLSLSARLVKEVDIPREETRQDPFQKRMQQMGEALIREGLRNLELASTGGGIFSSSSTAADVAAHGLRGVIQAAQEVHPGIKVPHTKPSESASDLAKLSPAELQTRFEATFKKDKALEKERAIAAMAGNVDEINKIMEDELANSQLLVLLAEVLERKGFKAQIPETEDVQSAAREAAELQAKAMQDACKTQ